MLGPEAIVNQAIDFSPDEQPVLLFPIGCKE